MEGEAIARRVGVVMDFSPCSRSTLQWAADNVAKSGDHLILITALKPLSYDQAMSESIVQKIDKMKSKIDDLKKSTNSQKARVCDLASISPSEKFNLAVLTLELVVLAQPGALGLASIGDNTARGILFHNGSGDDVKATDESRQMLGMSKTRGNIKLSVIEGEFPDSQFIIMLEDNGTEKFHLHVD
jgi:Universal stress protein family